MYTTIILCLLPESAGVRIVQQVSPKVNKDYPPQEECCQLTMEPCGVYINLHNQQRDDRFFPPNSLPLKIPWRGFVLLFIEYCFLAITKGASIGKRTSMTSTANRWANIFHRFLFVWQIFCTGFPASWWTKAGYRIELVNEILHAVENEMPAGK